MIPGLRMMSSQSHCCCLTLYHSLHIAISFALHSLYVNATRLAQGITFFFFFCCTMQHMGSLFPDQGSNPRPLQWKHIVLTTGPPGEVPQSIPLMANLGFQLRAKTLKLVFFKLKTYGQFLIIQNSLSIWW